MCAAQWGDIDLEAGVWRLQRTVTRTAEGKRTMGAPKSASGRRSVTLPAACVAALRRHQTAQKARKMQLRDIWQDAGYVFDAGEGSPINPNTVRAAFQRHAKRLGLPAIRVHDTRHTAATLMLGQGVHPKIVQERLGHSTVSMTLDKYSHVSMSMQQEAAERMERALGA
jgi:integrase